MSRVFANEITQPEEFAGMELNWPSEGSTSFSTEEEVTAGVLDWELSAHESVEPARLVERRVTDRTVPPPSRLAALRGYGGKRIKVLDETAKAYLDMVAAARRDNLAAPLLEIVSGFRDPKRQEQLWQQALKRYGSAKVARGWVAPPGHSVHQTGRAVDLWLGVPLRLLSLSQRALALGI
jgi:D-alanyl-D-alanine carboxypeptidase-like protein